MVGARKLVIKAAPDGDDVTVGVVRDSELLGALQSRRIYSDEQVRRIADAAVQARTWSLLPVSAEDPAELQAQFAALESELAAEAKEAEQPSRGEAGLHPRDRSAHRDRSAPLRAVRPRVDRQKKRRSVLPELMKLAVLAVVLIVAINYLGSLGAPAAPALQRSRRLSWSNPHSRRPLARRQLRSTS